MSCPEQRVRVFVNGEEISTDYVETQISSEGPAKSNRLTEFHFPAEWDGEDQQSKVDAFDPSTQSSYDLAEVYWQEPRSGTYVLDHYGFVRGVGGTDKNGVMKGYIADPSQMVTAIPFSNAYDRPSIQDVLTDCVERFNESTPFNAQLGSYDQQTLSGVENYEATDGDGPEGITGTISVAFNEGPIALGEYVAGGIKSAMKTSRRFKRNAHTLKDVLDWVCEIAGGYWYFSSSNPLRLVYDNDRSENNTFDATTGRQFTSRRNLINGGSFLPNGGLAVDVINNDALAEMFPVNTFTVHGVSNWSLMGHSVKALSSNKFPAVTVEDPVLKQRAGGQTVQDQIVKTQDKTLKSAENTAKTKLKNKIQTGGEGDIECFIRPDAIIGDYIRAVPECEDWVPNANLTPIEYEITGIRHVKSAYPEDGNQFEGTTSFTVSPISDQSRYEVIESEMMDL